jgi:hypothetical protein
MTSLEIEIYFSYHNANMRQLKIGFDEIRNQIKNLYKRQNRSSDFIFSFPDNNPEKIELRKLERSLARILSGIQVSWAEESIKRLYYEKDLLSDSQRDYLLERPALDQRWYKTLKIVFCIAYDLVPSGDELCETVNINHEVNNLGVELISQYFNLKRIITDYLAPNFTLRNKVQHGEWEYAFKPKFSKEFSQDLTNKVKHENLITSKSRYTIVNALYQMLVDMGRFKSDRFKIDSITTPFEYFYKDYIRKIDFEVDKVLNPKLEEFITEIVQREIRGMNYRA